MLYPFSKCNPISVSVSQRGGFSKEGRERFPSKGSTLALKGFLTQSSSSKSRPNLTTNIHNSSGYAGGAAQISQANAINDNSHPNLAINIRNSSGYAGGAAQISHENTTDNKSCPNLTANIHNSSGYAGGAAQISQGNTINDKSCPNFTTNIQ